MKSYAAKVTIYPKNGITMQQILNNLPLFVEVARKRSFTLAAEALNIPTSSLSRRIAALEKTLGIRLFNRNSRYVELTQAGEFYFSRCEFIVAETIAATEALTSTQLSPTGTVRLAAPNDFSTYTFPEVLLNFARLYPDISLEVTFTNTYVDLFTEPYDLALHIGEHPRSSLLVRRLSLLCKRLFATPKFLAAHPPITSPDNLREIPCLSLQQIGTTWHLLHKKEEVHVPIKKAHTFTSMLLLTNFTLAGLGVGCLAETLAAPHIAEGTLLPVLPEWSFPGQPCYLVTSNRDLPARVRLLADYLIRQSAQRFPPAPTTKNAPPSHG